MKGWEIIKKIANNEFKEGTRFRDDYNTYILKCSDLETKLILFREDENEKPDYTPDYSFFADNDNEFETIEENKISRFDEIRDLSTWTNKTLSDNQRAIIIKINKIIDKLYEEN